MDQFRRASVNPYKDEYLDNAQTFNRTSKLFEEFLHSFEQYDKEEQHKRQNSSSLMHHLLKLIQTIFTYQI
ncbi:uncharacterized protein LOC112685481 isoform X2 [Sipha flava]|uniref:Uncharacterized protein LOC112685481 isoform X2 n=1 Tax=Sipha flava TaxID=143950 RepID=A0A8B8FQH6_9HEMI|nr:uncharacterized protein LOC112685481 isoform X2 [Sipha flava]